MLSKVLRIERTAFGVALSELEAGERHLIEVVHERLRRIAD